MPKHIDADKFKSYIDCGHLRPPTEVCFSELDVVNMIDKQPAADAQEIKHGKWIEKTIRIPEPPGVSDGWYDVEIVVCSECDNEPKESYPPYCPCCGAKMDKEAGDEESK